MKHTLINSHVVLDKNFINFEIISVLGKFFFKFMQKCMLPTARHFRVRRHEIGGVWMVTSKISIIIRHLHHRCIKLCMLCCTRGITFHENVKWIKYKPYSHMLHQCIKGNVYMWAYIHLLIHFHLIDSCHATHWPAHMVLLYVESLTSLHAKLLVQEGTMI